MGVRGRITDLDEPGQTDDGVVEPSTYSAISLGTIPADWDDRRLGDEELVRRVGSGITPTGGQHIYKQEGRPFVRSQNVGWGTLLLDDLAYIDEATHASFRGSEIVDGDVLLNITGASIGRCAVANSTLAGGNVNQHVCEIRTNHAVLAPRFLCEFLLSERGQTQIDSFQAGGNRQGLNYSQVRSFLVPLPPPIEQRAIAAALADVDRLIGGVEALIAKKRAVKRAAMQQLLTGRTRLPGFGGEWETRRIGAFADCAAGGTPSTAVPAFWGGTVRWMSSGELNQKRVTEVEGRITKLGLRESSAKLVPSGSVLIGLAGQGRTRGTVAINLIELSTNRSIAAILPNAAFASEYLYHNLDMRYDELRSLSTGEGGRGGLNLSIIKSMMVPFPKVDEQRAIAAVLSDLDAEIEALERRREKTKAIKRGMMQALLTGRVRLVAPVGAERDGDGL